MHCALRSLRCHFPQFAGGFSRREAVSASWLPPPAVGPFGPPGLCCGPHILCWVPRGGHIPAPCQWASGSAHAARMGGGHEDTLVAGTGEVAARKIRRVTGRIHGDDGTAGVWHHRMSDG